MAELSRNFSGGKMNKDVDERLVPLGEYRDAHNIEIFTSEGSNVGTVQNIKGNTEQDPGSVAKGTASTSSAVHISPHSVCLASIADEKNNKIYSFIHDGVWIRVAGSSSTTPEGLRIKSNFILEYDVLNNSFKYVLNDIYYVRGYTSTAAGSSGNQITMANNQGVRAGMDVTITISSVTYTRKVKHTFATDGGTGAGDDITPSSTLVFLDEDIPAHSADVLLNFYSDISLSKGNLLKWTPNTKITGINILDDFLFWTDNDTEPKKINIKRCLAGTGTAGSSAGNLVGSTTTQGSDRTLHTRLFAELDAFADLQCVTSDDGTLPIFLEEKHITVIKRAPLIPPILEMSPIGLNRINPVDESTNLVFSNSEFNMAINDPTEGFISLKPGDNITITVLENVDWREGDLILCTENEPSDPSFITDATVLLKVISSGSNPPNASPLTEQAIYDFEVVSIGQGVPTGERLWYLALQKPDPIFEHKFVRFAYRYKYTDGEYSPYSPFSKPAFIPGPYNWKPSVGHNTGMSNILRGLKIKNYLPKINERPQDVVAVDILYKEETSPNIYTVKTINKQDGNSTGSTPLAWPDTTVAEYANKRGEYEITSEMIHAVLPSNQLIRPYDNIPRKALAQEIVGNRIVYGNYLQNYNIENADGEIKPEFELGFKSTKVNLTFTDDYTIYLNLAAGGSGITSLNSDAPFGGVLANIVANTIVNNGISVQAGDTIEGEPKTSVKSLRTYQVGVVYMDIYGRQTPVLTDKATGSIDIPKEFSDKQNKLSVTIKTPPPDWASHYKYYIKETSNEYYNLAMDRWYDADDGNCWISFPSSDRSKIDEETYLILKKAQGSGIAVKEKARYKILAIENEAPDYIKKVQYDLGSITSASASNYTNTTNYPNEAGDGFPVVDANVFKLDADAVDARFGVEGTTGSEVSTLVPLVSEGKLYVKFATSDNSKSSHVYRVGKVARSGTSTTTTEHFYEFSLFTKFEEDIDFLGSSSSATAHNIFFTKQEVEESAEFNGKFFVKIQRDSVLETNALAGAIGSEYLVKHTRPIHYSSGAINFRFQYDKWSTSAEGSSPPTDEGGSPPDNHHYYFKNSTMGVEGTSWQGAPTGSDAPIWDTDQMNFQTEIKANNTGVGQYAPIPWASQKYNPGNGTYSDEFSINRDENTTRQSGYFGSIDGKWCIDNENSSNGSAGRGICKDAQGSVLANVITNAHYKEGFGADAINDNSRVMWSGKDDSSWTKSGTNGRSGLNNGSGITMPSDVYTEPEHNVMHLSYFGIPDPLMNDFQSIEGNTALQHEWEFHKALMKVGTLFRWQDDPDETVYEITRVHVQDGIRNYQSDSNHNDYTLRDNKRVRYTIKFKNLKTGLDTGFGHDTVSRFHPLVNAVDGDGNAVVSVAEDNVTKDDVGAACEAYGYAGLAPDASNYLNLQIIEPYHQFSVGDKAENPNPAVFETEPKEDADLDIYYEASQAFPLEVTADSNELLIPVGSTFVINNHDYSEEKADGTNTDKKDNVTFTITKWVTKSDGKPGFIATPTGIIGTNIINASGAAGTGTKTYQVTTPHGNEVSIEIADNITATTLESTGVGIKGDAGGVFSPHNQKTFLGWHNCIAFGNGVESDRIRDDFNAATITNGVKASSVLAERYRQERRKSGLIYSGIYNSKSGVNNLNQFIAGEKITKDLNPDYGSIQKLHQRDGDLLTLCQDRILTIVANKDALYNADGNPQLISSNNVLGQAIALGGEYGISSNPESFAYYANNVYFTDTQRGSVMQIKGNSLMPISQIGMSDYFSDKLKDVDLKTCLGTYDEKKSEYNLTIVNKEAASDYGDKSYTTISYSEKSQGWTSFKKFYPEQGLSINNEYYTWYKGSMWKHHSNDTHNSFYSAITAVVDGAISSNILVTVHSNTQSSRIETGMLVSGTGVTANTTVDFISGNNIRFSSAQTISDDVTLTFTHVSSVTAVFNDSPHAVKSFSNLIYEGSQSRVIENDNDTNYHNIDSSTGWYCDSITTNKQEGEVPEFIEKEGRWYNHIRGDATTLSNLDPSEKSVQGVGVPSTESYSSTGNFKFKFELANAEYDLKNLTQMVSLDSSFLVPGTNLGKGGAYYKNNFYFFDNTGAFNNETGDVLITPGITVSGASNLNSQTAIHGKEAGFILEPENGFELTPENLTINGDSGSDSGSGVNLVRTITINADADGNANTNTYVEKVELSSNTDTSPIDPTNSSFYYGKMVKVKVFFNAVTPTGDATITFDFD